MTETPRILVIRNDKLGDFMLAWPALSFLKRSCPEAEVYALVPGYTRPLAEICPWIDQIIEDPGRDADKKAQQELLGKIRDRKFDASITLFSTTRIGVLLSKAKIPHRYAPATKMAQVFYNHRIVQRRSHSIKPEYEYNIDLIEAWLNDQGIASASRIERPYLSFSPEQMASVRDQFLRHYNIEQDQKLIFIHPGSGGSANNISVEQYARLGKNLSATDRIIVITVGPGEETAGSLLKAMLERSQVNVRLRESTGGLVPFAMDLNLAEVFIAGSTGPLHIAGALNRPIAGFYPKGQVTSSLRWQTLSEDARRLAFCPPPQALDNDMSKIDLDEAAEQIVSRFLI